MYSLDLNILKCFFKFKVLKNKSYHLLEDILNSFRKKYSFYYPFYIDDKAFYSSFSFFE